MGTALKNPAGKDLYALWRKRLTDSLAEELRSQQVGYLLKPGLHRVRQCHQHGAATGARSVARIPEPVPLRLAPDHVRHQARPEA